MKTNYITPVAGQVYTNHNGSTYICLKGGEGEAPGPDMTAEFERQPDGWTLIAHGVAQYEDGTIVWNYSTDGHWPGGCPKHIKH